MSATDANRAQLATERSSDAQLASLLFALRRPPRAFIYKTGFRLSLDGLLLHMKFVHSNHNLHQTTGRERGIVDSMRVRGQIPQGSRKADSVVARDHAVDLKHHPLQRAQGPKREPVARGSRGGEERHDEPEGVD